MTRSGAARATLLQGLDVLEQEYGVAAKRGAKPAKKGGKRPGKA